MLKCKVTGFCLTLMFARIRIVALVSFSGTACDAVVCMVPSRSTIQLCNLTQPLKCCSFQSASGRSCNSTSVAFVVTCLYGRPAVPVNSLLQPPDCCSDAGVHCKRLRLHHGAPHHTLEDRGTGRSVWGSSWCTRVPRQAACQDPQTLREVHGTSQEGSCAA